MTCAMPRIYVYMATALRFPSLARPKPQTSHLAHACGLHVYIHRGSSSQRHRLVPTAKSAATEELRMPGGRSADISPLGLP
jgi:hypothetical protein